MELFNISDFSNINITSRLKSITLETISSNILNELWTFEHDNKIFTLSKIDIEKLAFSIIRSIPIVKINILSYSESNIQKFKILNSESQIIGLILYLLGVMPKSTMSIKSILQAIKDNDFEKLKRIEFNLKSNTDTISLSFNSLSDDLKSIILNRDIAVSICCVDIATSNTVNFIKSMMCTSH